MHALQCLHFVSVIPYTGIATTLAYLAGMLSALLILLVGGGAGNGEGVCVGICAPEGGWRQPSVKRAINVFGCRSREIVHHSVTFDIRDYNSLRVEGFLSGGLPLPF